MEGRWGELDGMRVKSFSKSTDQSDSTCSPGNVPS